MCLLVSPLLVGLGIYLIVRLLRTLHSGESYDDEHQELVERGKNPVRFWFHVGLDVLLIAICFWFAQCYWR